MDKTLSRQFRLPRRAMRTVKQGPYVCLSVCQTARSAAYCRNTNILELTKLTAMPAIEPIATPSMGTIGPGGSI